MPDLLIENKPADMKLAELFRIVHTFKGTFGQLHMGNVMSQLHTMEGSLDTIRAQKIVDITGQELAEELTAFTPENMLGWLEADLAVLKEKLGENFFQRENVLVIDNTRLIEIEDKVKSTLSGDACGLLLSDLRRLRYKPFRELLSSYPEYVCGLAERNEKAVHLFSIEGDDTLVDPLRYYDFIKSLGHVFRNSIVHGLETFDERLEAGKDEVGTITCKVTESEAGLQLVITDDGRGINPAQIRDIAVEKGICTLEAAHAMQEAECVQLIFADGFSGAKQVDTFAGRGVGLSAVRAELENIGGSVSVHSVVGRGTEFKFFLPFSKSKEDGALSVRQLAKPILNAMEWCLKNQAGLEVKSISYEGGGVGGKLKLRKVTTFLGVKGFPNAKILLSADQAVVQYLSHKKETANSEDAMERKLENALAKYALEFFQRAVNEIPQWPSSITAKALVSILAEDASAMYPNAEISTFVVITELGNLYLSLVY
jgi:hypothetical protein